MKITSLLILLMLGNVFVYAQRVGIGTTDPASKLEIKDTSRTRLTISSANYEDSSQLVFKNRNAINQGTEMMLSANKEQGIRISSSSDLPRNTHDSIMQITPQGKVGINVKSPSELLDVNGNINLTGAIKINTNGGKEGQLLKSNGDGTMAWSDGYAAVSSGYGAWGDCATNNIISGYQPIVDTPNAYQPEYYGSSVSISGQFAIVGNPGDNNYVSGASKGAAHIYRYQGGKWVLMKKITDETILASSLGSAVSISGNYAVVGAPTSLYPYASGFANVYFFDGSNWVFMQKLFDPTGVNGDSFGASVQISGNLIIIGAPEDDNGAVVNQGSASIYQLTGNSWTLMQKILDATGATSDFFGSSVSISGNFAVVGAPSDDNGTYSDQGSSSVYRLSGSVWYLTNKFTNLTARAGVRWGRSVALSNNTLVIGAPGNIVGGNILQGSITIFEFNGSNWIYGGVITDPDGAAYDGLGATACISGDYVIVGAPGALVGGNSEQGKVTVFIKIGFATLQKVITILDPGGTSGNYFGSDVSVDAANKWFIIGASGANADKGKVVLGKVN